MNPVLLKNVAEAMFKLGAKEIELRVPDTPGRPVMLTGKNAQGAMTGLVMPVRNTYGTETAIHVTPDNPVSFSRGGVKYPVDSYGKPIKDGDEVGWNYVSFRDDNIRVDHKWVDGQARYSIIGRKGADNGGFGIEKLAFAEELEAKGESREQIWRATGWWRGADGKWRVEIPNAANFNVDAVAKWVAEINSLGGMARKWYELPTLRLDEALKDKWLFAAYPQARGLTLVVRDDLGIGTVAALHSSLILISANELSRGPDHFLPLILHEVQHFIQSQEEFARGTSEALIQAARDANDRIISRINSMMQETEFPSWLRTQAQNRQMAKIAEESRRKWPNTHFLLERAYAESVGDRKILEQLDAADEARTHNDHYAGYGHYVEDAYRQAGGEVEARNVERRLRMTSEERAATPPWETQDVADEDQIRFSITPAEDAEYADAVKRGDKETYMRLLKAAAARRGYVTPHYFDAHSAPAPAYVNGGKKNFRNLEELRRVLEEDGGDLNLFAMANGISSVPDDYLTRQGLKYYGQEAYGAAAHESLDALLPAVESIRKQMQQDGEVSDMPKVKVYRAVPKTVKEGSLQSEGQWVSPSKTYAKEHGEHRFGRGQYRIIEQEVGADELWFDGNAITEWGFDDGTANVYKNTRHNRKLLEPTYDDAGNLIPLSQRFNDRNAGIRFSITHAETPNIANSYDEARAVLKEEIGAPFVNRKSNISATLSGNSINKLLSGKAVGKSIGIKEHLAAVANIKPLFENGDLLETELGNRKGVEAARKFYTAFTFQGQELVAKITVLEYEKNDHRIYSVEAMEVSRAESILAPNGSMNQAVSPAPPLSTNIIPYSAPESQEGKAKKDPEAMGRQAIVNYARTGKDERPWGLTPWTQRTVKRCCMTWLV